MGSGNFFKNNISRIVLSLNLLLLFVLILILLTINPKSCSRTPWKLDDTYSEYLTTNAESYKNNFSSEVYETVDALRVYKVENPRHLDMYDLPILFDKDMVFETENKNIIKRFLLSAQKQISPHENCYDPNENRIVYHILAFDNTFMRVGYFIFVVDCASKGEAYGVIHPLQKDIYTHKYYNKSLLSTFKEYKLIQ